MQILDRLGLSSPSNITTRKGEKHSADLGAELALMCPAIPRVPVHPPSISTTTHHHAAAAAAAISREEQEGERKKNLGKGGGSKNVEACLWERGEGRE